MTTLTTSNAKKILQEWRDQDLDIYMEAVSSRYDQKAGHAIRFTPGYEGDLYQSETLTLFIPPAREYKPKILKNHDAILKLAEKYQINPQRIIWKVE